MSLFDRITELAGVAGTSSGGQNGLVQSLLGMLGSGPSGGGLADIVRSFEQNGLGDLVSSWVGTGQNLPISPGQVQAGLGAGRLQQLAQAAGLPEGAAAGALSTILPGLIDRLTPNGAIPHAAGMDEQIAAVRKALGF